MDRKCGVKRPPGVMVRQWQSGRTTLRIQFYYKGVLCRETLRLDATPSNIKYAARLRSEIINAIERNTFNYADFFPTSKSALRFGHASTRVAIKELLNEYLSESKRRTEHSAYIRLCRNCHTHLYPYFGDIAIQDLKGMAIRRWIKAQTCKKKTISNILISLRAVVQQALMDEYIDHDPFDKVIISKLVDKEAAKSEFVVDPFDREEIQTILDKAEKQIKNLYQFAFFTGLRPSELMGLRWSDVDWIHGLIRVEETIVDKEKKGPKTEAGYREVLLLQPALEALEAQKQHTFLADGRVFHNPRTNQPWETSQQLRRTAWMHLLKRAGVRYRNPYQTRHTYASMMISQGENIMWVSQQMGHASMEVTLKRYARWISDDSTRGGYRPRHDWSAHLSDPPSLAVSDGPKMSPLRALKQASF